MPKNWCPYGTWNFLISLALVSSCQPKPKTWQIFFILSLQSHVWTIHQVFIFQKVQEICSKKEPLLFTSTFSFSSLSVSSGWTSRIHILSTAEYWEKSRQLATRSPSPRVPWPSPAPVCPSPHSFMGGGNRQVIYPSFSLFVFSLLCICFSCFILFLLRYVLCTLLCQFCIHLSGCHACSVISFIW